MVYAVTVDYVALREHLRESRTSAQDPEQWSRISLEPEFKRVHMQVSLEQDVVKNAVHP